MENLFIEVFNEYSDDIYRLAFSYTQNYSDSEDIVQIVFLKYYNNMARLPNNKIEIKKWLFKVTINECKDLFKSAWRKYTCKIDDNIDNPILVPEDEDLIQSIEKLSKKYRFIIHLYYFYGYSIKEISDLLSINENTVKQRLARARKFLKLELEDKNE